jgi:3-oxoacyl-[acyl-carrier-protein] synthase-3
LFCTQTPDYLLPSSACLIHQQIGLRKNCAALDLNMGCSGYIYGLSLAKGLIESGIANTVLLLTGDTYSKLISHDDRSVRPLFGDAATATLITKELSDTPLLDHFVFGTDGNGASNLIVHDSACRGMTEKMAENFMIMLECYGQPLGYIWTVLKLCDSLCKQYCAMSANIGSCRYFVEPNRSSRISSGEPIFIGCA